MRTVYLATAFVLVLALSVLGFRGSRSANPPADVFAEWMFPSMRRQVKYKPQGSSPFFADGRADRLPPPGTVPTGYGPAGQPLREDTALYLGRNADGSFVRGFPAGITVDGAFMERGRERYGIYCSPCHGAVGDGNGVTKQYGMGATPSYHDDRIRGLAEGEIFNVITNGKPPAYNMSPYADKLAPEDRWAVVAYVRALQRAQHATIPDVPKEHLQDPGLK
jgi:mono/diheme cytochrome c family protein